MSEVFAEDVDKVRELTIQFAKNCQFRVECGFLVVGHPFAEQNPAMINIDGDIKYFNITTEKGNKDYLKALAKMLKKFSIEGMYYLVRTPFKFEWLQICKPYLQPDTFTEIFAETWTCVEFPNTSSIPPETLIEWFKEAKKEQLMDKDNLAAYRQLSEVLTLYRGVPKNGVVLGLSWTTDLKTAQFFKNRTGSKGGKIYSAVVPKSAVLAFYGDREEQEVVLDVFAVKDSITEHTAK